MALPDLTYPCWLGTLVICRVYGRDYRAAGDARPIDSDLFDRDLRQWWRSGRTPEQGADLLRELLQKIDMA